MSTGPHARWFRARLAGAGIIDMGAGEHASPGVAVATRASSPGDELSPLGRRLPLAARRPGSRSRSSRWESRSP